MLFLGILILQCAINVPFLKATRLRGHLATTVHDAPFQDWQFLTRFCFLSRKGNFKFSIMYPEVLQPLQILLYYDDIWSKAYSYTLNCTSKRALLTRRLGQIIDLVPSLCTACTRFIRQGERWIRCDDARYFKTLRERWWFIVISNCGVQNLNLEYNLHLTNGEQFLYKEYSADEFYIFPIDLTSFFANLILCGVSLWVAIKLISCQLFHTTYRLYMLSLWLYTFHLLFTSISQGTLGRTGVEDRASEVIGNVLDGVSHIIFVLMLILVAKGYTITRGRISPFGTVLITCFMVLYTLMYIGVLVWEEVYFDEAKVLYRYESVPGYIMMGLRLLGAVMFLICAIFTIHHYPEKFKFYIPLVSFYLLWFLAGPVIMLISVNAMAKWTREKTVNGVENCVALLAYILFMILTLPMRVNKMFPFHVKTSQIGVIDDAPHQEPGEEGFPENECSASNMRLAFRSSSQQSAPDFSDLFVVSHTKSIEWDKPTGKTQRTARDLNNETSFSRTLIPSHPVNKSSSQGGDALATPGADSPPPSYDSTIRHSEQ